MRFSVVVHKNSNNSPPCNCSPGEKDVCWGSDNLFTLMPIPLLESGLGVSDIHAGEAAASIISKIKLKLDGAPGDCKLSSHRSQDYGQ